MLRTHTCGELRKKNVGATVTLAGWADSIRVQGKIGFILLRDRYGLTQCFIGKELAAEHNLAEIRKESVLRITGEVKARPANQVRTEMATGEIEVSATALEVLNPADPLPLELDENIVSTEETRLQWRYLDLRRPRMQQNLITRHAITKAMRDYLGQHGFLEIETPFLAKSTPEGARDYLVPSRIKKGSFYALPQSPQLFKQLLMIGGYDRYAQIVKCFRDEDLRADRQPEFTQLDIEMSFVEEEDVIQLIEGLMVHLFKEVLGVALPQPFKRLTYKESMEQYGRDNPDLREELGVDWAPVWIVDFPMFEYSEEDKRWYAMHHPFTQPRELDLLLAGKHERVFARAYDLVLNGSEVAGGSIRMHRYDDQIKVFEALGMREEDYKEKFGFFLNALRYGAPPHGGIAFGLDRLAALMTGCDSIRDVIAFPKNKEAADLMLDAPSSVTKEQLDELGLKKA
ncbi:aspartate--tRNA ligase [Candidatus Woesearchaeota archaeon]|nr:MAG: aspartate--tRNA ligase [Candidatus Woesearchaeota archaeon]